jgi:hypothetical protein
MVYRCRFLHHFDAIKEIAESDLITTDTESEWQELPESRSTAWSVHRRYDGQVLANRLVGVPVVAGSHLPGATAPAVDL